jgi:hypothetical protein
MYTCGPKEQVERIVPLVSLDFPAWPTEMPDLPKNHFLACGIVFGAEEIIGLVEKSEELKDLFNEHASRGAKVNWYDLNGEQAAQEILSGKQARWLVIEFDGGRLEITDVHPDPCFIITDAERNGIVGNSKRMIMLFSSEEKATKHMAAFGIEGVCVIPISWEYLVEKYSGSFSHGIIDANDRDDIFQVVPLTLAR